MIPLSISTSDQSPHERGVALLLNRMCKIRFLGTLPFGDVRGFWTLFPYNLSPVTCHLV